MAPSNTLRRVCAWCDPQHPTDGRGPIRPGEPVSHGMCATAYAAALAGPGAVILLPARVPAPRRELSPILEIPGPVGMGWDSDPDGDYLGGFGQ